MLSIMICPLPLISLMTVFLLWITCLWMRRIKRFLPKANVNKYLFLIVIFMVTIKLMYDCKKFSILDRLMKKPNQDIINLQIRNNIKLRNQLSKVSRSPMYKYTNYTLPKCVDLHNKSYRAQTIKAIESIKLHKNSEARPYFDFFNVVALTPMAMIYFKQTLDRHKEVVCRGRQSQQSVVAGMLSKLDMSKRLGFKNSKSEHDLVERWYFFSGENTDLGEGYDEIESVLAEKFGEDSETFDVINTAIGEAVINVVNHAYDSQDKYKKWYLFLSITPNVCNVVISDLGRSIPNSIPTKIKDHVLQRVFNINSWGGLKDDSKIEIATQYQKTATELPNRGKGFQDMQAVCEQIEGAVMTVHSRGGLWARSIGSNGKIKKQNYKSLVNGTIISWLLPLNDSTIPNTSR